MSAETTSTPIATVRAPGLLRRHWPWLAAIAIALLLPWLFFDWTKGRHSGFVLTMLSEIGLMSVFALSFNMLMGQTGLLSFGHAILFGLGGYCTAHALNAVKAGTLWLPVELVPLVGGLGGLVFGAAFGYVVTKQRATAFAMITMGLGELVAACALMFMGFFGGEGGIPTDRMVGTSLVGVDYSSSWQVYCLIVAWVAIATVLMRLQTQTPLGRMANAQRDNFERTQFVGYDPRMIRFYQFTLSGFFAGIGGALYVLVYEIVTFDTVAAAKSATALLATYIGGAGSFLGPFLGTVVVVLLQSGVSLISNAWLLYVGGLFIVMVMFAPGGIMGIVARHEPIARIGRLGELVVPYARILPPGLLSVLGFVTLVELAQLTTIGAAQNKSLAIGGQAIDPHSALPWATGAVMLIGGGLWLRREARVFRVRWDALIEEAKARGLPV
ncbi:MAG: branched-chain amino acid ABC transporter permease [Reyranella sp.]|uniref:branched-chain amino acid ABC transporter permease n=1 Tax=Reyranella sp. TaxID=1929291 RepID=UPI001AD5A584|nr:branched-chain amino acid ABC transporter permease [Reyranella sp.]MBN9088289.1 branched-chain amino acid ABC transporter permease [Reyranella sp.]